MRTNITLAVAALAAVSLTSIPVRAEDEHRQLGAHEHGHGTLDIAVEGKRVSMELEVPGMDIVGFEHEATTPEQKAALEKAKADLAKPLALFKLPAAAECAVGEVTVALEAEHGSGHEHGNGKADPAKTEDDDHDDKHAEADHDDDEHEGHNAFHVTYALHCQKPASLTAITFDYFKAFAGAQNLTVNVVTAKAQNSYEVGRDKPELDLGGTM
jgi:hypothetical protein